MLNIQLSLKKAKKKNLFLSRKVNNTLEKTSKYKSSSITPDQSPCPKSKTPEKPLLDTNLSEKRLHEEKNQILKGFITTRKPKLKFLIIDDRKHERKLIGKDRITPEIISRSKNFLGRSCTPIKRNLSPGVFGKSFDIECLADACLDIKEQNMRLRKKIPNVQRSLKNSFKNMKKIVNIVQQPKVDKDAYRRICRQLKRNIVNIVNA
ncbi:hypothetical protein SteCoe_4794 [Stentor coeruleus]|uniref:Uncharacterized protein n=1 Tax=Stentor coeruleus TaxID=5963 RepID=A0A1R2CU00_9CILI|nr:hypothetical protein SteCoe_4794 [Stentor coeruleus]